MKNYTSQSAGQSYSWLCIMLTSHNHCRGVRGRDVGRESEREVQTWGGVCGGEGDGVKWSKVEEMF